MGLFSKKIVKNIPDMAWGYMVSTQNIDVDTLSKQMRCVERKGALEGGQPVTFLRIFKLADASTKGITVTGWETFDEHPELILFEGYLTSDNKAHLERKKA